MKRKKKLSPPPPRSDHYHPQLTTTTTGKQKRSKPRVVLAIEATPLRTLTARPNDAIKELGLGGWKNYGRKEKKGRSFQALRTERALNWRNKCFCIS